MHVEIGRDRIQVLEVSYTGIAQGGSAQSGNRHRSLLQGFLAAACGDDHFLEYVALGGNGLGKCWNRRANSGRYQALCGQMPVGHDPDLVLWLLVLVPRPEHSHRGPAEASGPIVHEGILTAAGYLISTDSRQQSSQRAAHVGSQRQPASPTDFMCDQKIRAELGYLSSTAFSSNSSGMEPPPSTRL